MTKALLLPPTTPEGLPICAFLRQAHTIVALLFFALILAHLSAALVHGLIRREGVLKSVTSGTDSASV